MSNRENELDIIHIRQTGGKAYAVVVIEQAIKRWHVFRSSRTGTEYRIDAEPLYLSDATIFIDPAYPKVICDIISRIKIFQQIKRCRRYAKI